jgi:hypothetical protein
VLPVTGACVVVPLARRLVVDRVLLAEEATAIVGPAALGPGALALAGRAGRAPTLAGETAAAAGFERR